MKTSNRQINAQVTTVCQVGMFLSACAVVVAIAAGVCITVWQLLTI